MNEANLDFYLDNFRGMVESIVALQPINTIKMTSYTHAIARVEMFEKAFPEKDSRILFTELINRIFDDARFKLKEINSASHLAFLEEVKSEINKKLKLILTRQNHLSTEALIVMMDYLGLLKHLGNEYNQSEQSALLSVLLDRSEENIKKAIRNVSGLPSKGNVKNEMSLNNVKQVAEKLNLKSLLVKVEEDLVKLNQTKKKKG